MSSFNSDTCASVLLKCFNCTRDPSCQAAVPAALQQVIATSCSPEDVMTGASKRIYVGTTAEVCSMAKSVSEVPNLGLVSDVTCCTTDACNLPPLLPAPNASSALQCYQGVGDSSQLMPVTSARCSRIRAHAHGLPRRPRPATYKALTLSPSSCGRPAASTRAGGRSSSASTAPTTPTATWFRTRSRTCWPWAAPRRTSRPAHRSR